MILGQKGKTNQRGTHRQSGVDHACFVLHRFSFASVGDFKLDLKVGLHWCYLRWQHEPLAEV